MENKYVSFEVYRPVKSPTEKGEYMGKTPIAVIEIKY